MYSIGTNITIYPFPEIGQETGQGKVSVQTPSGDSSTGQTPVLFADKNSILIQIGCTLENKGIKRLSSLQTENL